MISFLFKTANNITGGWSYIVCIQSDNGMQHNKGDYVVYGENGVCKIIDIRDESFAGLDVTAYYVLETVYSHTTIFIPLNSEALSGKLKKILSVEKINALIDDTAIITEEWIEDCKERAKHFEELLNGGERCELLWLIKVLSTHKTEVEEKNKRFYISDKNILTAAEKVITEEFAFVLGIDKSDVVHYIRKRIAKNKLKDKTVDL